ncbi:hypothetical protein GQ55_9G616900 [Panicum hallii var. hallii]|uniref:Uncharacterized protein n=1 Tax=Panicum hallii var. hallii TaxID=1504633 RepID=A0A2T7CHZ9_9POAL|nr:hypothetical protein GQ55_9G616900 [Panicum hallii var. hallii]
MKQGLLLMNNETSVRGGARVKKATWQSASQASKGNNVLLLHVGRLLLKFSIKKHGIVPMFGSRIWAHAKQRDGVTSKHRIQLRTDSIKRKDCYSITEQLLLLGQSFAFNNQYGSRFGSNLESWTCFKRFCDRYLLSL